MKPLFNAGVSEQNAGRLPADRVWGVGPKTKARIEERLEAPASVHDFAFFDLAEAELGRAQRALLGQQQSRLINSGAASIHEAHPAVGGAVRGLLAQVAASALEAPTPHAQSEEQRWLREDVQMLASAYAVYGAVIEPARPEEIRRALGIGLEVGAGHVVFAARGRRSPLEAPSLDEGLVLVSFDPRRSFEPIRYQRDGDWKTALVRRSRTSIPCSRVFLARPDSPGLRIEGRLQELFDVIVGRFGRPAAEQTAQVGRAERLHAELRRDLAEHPSAMSPARTGKLKALETLLELV